jgi:hypothetical protein
VLSQKWREKKLSKCKHYNGCINTTCKAGVNYAELAGGELGMMNRLPCWGDTNDSTEEIRPCASREFPTVEEVDAEEKRVYESLTRTVRARTAITDYLKANNKPLRNVSGTIPCPICGGTLGFSIAYNGHCHGHCSAQGCVYWME